MSAVAQPGMSAKRAGASEKSVGAGTLGVVGVVIGGRGGIGVRLPLMTGAGRLEAQPARTPASDRARTAR